MEEEDEEEEKESGSCGSNVPAEKETFSVICSTRSPLEEQLQPLLQQLE